MVSELQTVVVNIQTRSFVHETVDSPIRAPSKSPCLLRATLGAPFLFPRVALRDRCPMRAALSLSTRTCGSARRRGDRQYQPRRLPNGVACTGVDVGLT